MSSAKQQGDTERKIAMNFLDPVGTIPPLITPSDMSSAVTVIVTTIAMGLPGAGMWENGGKKLEWKQGLPTTLCILELFFPLLKTETVEFPWNSLSQHPVTYHPGTHFQVLGFVEVS